MWGYCLLLKQPDIAGRGKPSDHQVPIARKYTDIIQKRRGKNVNQVIKPFQDSGIIECDKWIINEEFSKVKSADTRTDMVAEFGEAISYNVEIVFSTKEVTF